MVLELKEMNLCLGNKILKLMIQSHIVLESVVMDLYFFYERKGVRMVLIILEKKWRGLKV